VVSNQLSLYPSFLLVPGASGSASSGHDKVIILLVAPRNFQDDKPEEKSSHCPHSSIILQPSIGTDNEIETEITPPVKRVTSSKSSMAGSGKLCF
jgi:hypothetical protein